MKVIGFKVLVEIINGDVYEKTSSGLYTPQKQNPNEKAKVVGVGYSTKDSEKFILKEGDVVLIHKGAGYPVVLDGKNYVMMGHDDVAGILENSL